MTVTIHPTAVVGKNANIGEGCEIGPYCILEDDVTLGPGNRMMANVYVGRYTRIGSGNLFYPYSTVGVNPQDLKFDADEVTYLQIGDNNTIREHATLHRGTNHGGGKTVIGSDCLIMVGGHVAHDCRVGDRTIISHSAALAGHVIVGHDATVGAASSVHQFCRVGNYAFIGGHSVVVKDALPFIKTVGNHAKIYGINTIGLDRKGFPADQIKALRDAYRILFQKKLRLVEAIEQLKQDFTGSEQVGYLTKFIEESERGITR